jgi:hypothetical protein
MTEEFRKLCKKFHDEIERSGELANPSAVWSEPDLLVANNEYEKTRALVIILRTVGCGWARRSGCSMCGYLKDSSPKPASTKNLLMQIDKAMKNYNGEEIVKIFTSGSFLDYEEIPREAQKMIFEKIKMKTKAEKMKKLSIESRPEFVTDRIQELSAIIEPSSLEISIGLESASDFILENSINKGFSFNDWEKAAKKVLGYGCKLKTYLLIKPLFLTEKEAIDDCVKSASMVAPLSTTISFNPVNVQSHTLVEYLWKRNEYRPPWLWSIVEILKKSSKLAKKKRIQCDVVGGGKERGAHNCGKCDKKFLMAIKNFSLSQDVSSFGKLDCECEEEWLDSLEIEKFLLGYRFPR